MYLMKVMFSHLYLLVVRSSSNEEESAKLEEIVVKFLDSLLSFPNSLLLLAKSQLCTFKQIAVHLKEKFTCHAAKDFDLLEKIMILDQAVYDGLSIIQFLFKFPESGPKLIKCMYNLLMLLFNILMWKSLASFPNISTCKRWDSLML